jgi:hypothetical protein
MRRAVLALGVLAAVCVVASSVLVLHAGDGRTQRPQALRLRAHGLELSVPAGRWRLEPSSRAIAYGEAVLRAPAVLDEGFCPSAGSSSRAFVGLLAPVPGSVSRVVARTGSQWARAVSAAAAVAVPRASGPRLDLDVPVPQGPCAPATAHLTLVGRSTPAGVVVLLLVRDVGEPRDLSASQADAIVTSLRPVG